MIQVDTGRFTVGVFQDAVWAERGISALRQAGFPLDSLTVLAKEGPEAAALFERIYGGADRLELTALGAVLSRGPLIDALQGPDRDLSTLGLSGAMRRVGFQAHDGRIFETLRMMHVVSIAAVEGRAWGGGFELALGCNLILAAEDATFALPEVANGVIPPIASIVLPRVSPRRRAMEWILTGRRISAGELEHFGLVNRLFTPPEFEAGLSAFLGELTSKSGPLLQLAKRAQYEAYYATYEEALYKVQNMYLRELVGLDDMKEGVRAHLEGRKPEWSHT